MNVLETLQGLQSTPIPNLLVLAGIIFLILAFVGEIGAVVRLPKNKQKWAGAIGALLLGLGTGMYLVPKAEPASVIPAPSPVESTLPPLIESVPVTPTEILPTSTPSLEKFAAELLSEAQRWQAVVGGHFDSDTWPETSYESDVWHSTSIITENDTFLATVTYIGEGSEAGKWFIPVLDQVSDFYLNVDGRLVRGSDSNSYGLLFRSNGADTPTYAFRCFEDRRRFDVQIITDETWKELTGATPSPGILPGEFNRLTVIARGTDFYFYIDGKFVHHVSDHEMARGNVGLRVSAKKGVEQVVEFDNFELRIPPE